jgi:type I restriction enzyme R subunit
MQQSVQDKSTVQIYYESRLIPLDLTNANLDEDYKEIVNQAEAEGIEQHRLKWSALEKVIGTPKRLETLAKDILEHFSQVASPEFKGMIVCMNRNISVALYNFLRKQPNCPPIEVIMTGDVDKDPEDWRKTKQPGSEYPHIKTKDEQKAIKKKLKDPEDPLKLVIVCDMWLTGTDIPPLTFLYVDKPMKGHNLMQAIARVNRVFPGKEGGIVVDYIGITIPLQEATRKYTQGGGRGKPTEDISEAALKIFMDNFQEIRTFLPENTDVINWRGFNKVEREDFLADLVGLLLGERKDSFLTIQLKLEKSHQLIRHLPSVIPYVNEILLYDILAVQLRKLTSGGSQGGKKKQQDVDKKINKLVDDSIAANDVIDIFAVAGLEKPDISILDESFLADLTKKKHENLRLKLLEKLLQDKIQIKIKQNNPKYKSIKQTLEKTINDYHNQVIKAADVIRMMIQVKKGMDSDTQMREELDLSEEEMSFYHIVEGLGEASFSNEFVANLIHKVVAAMKKEFQVDWTNPHRQDILAKVNLAVKMVLMKEKIKAEQIRFLTNALVEQAKEQYKDYPLKEA